MSRKDESRVVVSEEKLPETARIAPGFFLKVLCNHPEDFVHGLEDESRGPDRLEILVDDPSFLRMALHTLSIGTSTQCERELVIAVSARDVVFRFVGSHHRNGGITEELQWVARNIGTFLEHFPLFQRAAYAGLCQASEEVTADRHEIPDYVYEMLGELIGPFWLEAPEASILREPRA